MTSEPRHHQESGLQTELHSQSPADGFRSEWVPEVGHRSCQTGIYLDAVRITGERGMQVTQELIAATDDNAGPIILRTTGQTAVYFILPPRTAEALRWPPGVFAYGDHHREYVAIPALGASGCFQWESKPTAAHPFVQPRRLYEMVCQLTGWNVGRTP